MKIMLSKCEKELFLNVKMLFLLPFLFLLNACESGENETAMDETPFELSLPMGFPMPEIPEDNALTVARVELGERLFFDPILSLDATISCASCHFPDAAFSDTVALSRGVSGRLGFRNSPSLLNVAYHPFFFKDGGVPSLEMQGINPIQDENEMAFTMTGVLERLREDEEYKTLNQKAYGRAIDAFSVTRALAAYQRTLIGGNSPFDAYFYEGDTTALSETQKRGMALFFSERTNCSTCHSGFNFTNNGFANNGLYANYEDDGRRRVTANPADEGLFKVPTLRNVQLTAPYMHDGSLSSLEVVIQHYNEGGQAHFNKSELLRPLVLSEQEQKDLRHFLEALTGEVVE